MSVTAMIRRTSVVVSAFLLGVASVGVGGLGLPASALAAEGGLALDGHASGKATSGSTVTSAGITTTQRNDLLVAFVGSDGPGARQAQSFSLVSGGGLTWQLQSRSADQYGTAEIWSAVAPTGLSNVAVKATHGGSYAASIHVVAFSGASSIVHSAAASAATGAPRASLTTTQAGSWVWGTGNDWSNATGRTVGSGQTLQNQYLNTGSGDSFWTQSQTGPTASAGTVVTMNDTAPVGDMWNFALVEISPVRVDTTPPSVPQGLTGSSPTPYRAVLNWQASSDDTAVTGYDIYRDGSLVTSSVSGTTYTDMTVSPATTYSYTVSAFDAAGNVSAQSSAVAVTTGSPDTTPPSVGLTQPTDGATLTGTVNLAATATDDVSVQSVQFSLTNLSSGIRTLLGSAITTAPYGYAWSSASVTNGSYSLSAVATDEAGNTATAAPITVTVSNTNPVRPSLDPASPAAIGIPGSTCASPTRQVSTSNFSAPAGSRMYVVASADSYPIGVTDCLNETGQNSISNVSSAVGLSWSRLAYTTQRDSNVGGFVDVWTAAVPTDQSGMSLTVNFTYPMKAEPGQVSPSGQLQVIIVDNAGQTQTVTPVAVDQLSSMTTTASATVQNTPANSLVFLAVDYWNSYSTPPRVPVGQTIVGTVNNQGETDTWTVSALAAPTASGPGPITLSQTITDPSHPTDNWHAVAWAVTP